MRTIITLKLAHEQDVVLCRQRVRQVAELLGFDRQEQTRIATAASEILRNAFEYAGGGRVEIGVDGPGSGHEPRRLVVVVQDSGPGIPDLGSIFAGTYVSSTGMGLGMMGARRLMEDFDVESKPGAGTRVTLRKALPDAAPALTPQFVGQLADQLARRSSDNPYQELQRQNHELMAALEELQARQSELARLNRELEETNRGVVALYAELDEKAASLKRASEAKTSFLSSMTHEFRTPLNSILGLSRAALDGADGELSPEHRRQVTYIQKSAEALSELVNDLLDIAKVEAGKVDVKARDFAVSELLAGLRGVLKPLAASRPAVALLIEDPARPLTLRTDEGKLGQILRNLVSNALKYTVKGQVRVSVREEGGGRVRFDVADTGIGIAPENQERIFDEFVQIESPLQKLVKGTGLGLPLSRRLARLLGGALTVSSRPGQGSTFTLSIPLRREGGAQLPWEGFNPRLEPPPAPVFGEAVAPAPGRGTGGLLALVIDDDEVARYLLSDLLAAEELTVREASTGFEGVLLACAERPDVVLLDLQMPGMSGFQVLELLKANPLTRDIPVIIHTAMSLGPEESARLLRDAKAVLSKDSPPDERRAHLKEAIAASFPLLTPERSTCPTPRISNA